jgi:polar amino acid transport system substrate-binding protein
MSRRLVPALAVGLALALVAGCAGDASLPSEVTGSVPEEAAPATTAPPTCSDTEKAEDPTRSFEPDGALPAPEDIDADPNLPTVQRIKDSGQLVVGVSGDTLLFGSRNPLTGAIEGFDIDMLKAVARAIFGEGGEDKIVYKVITYAQRLPSLESGAVDIVAHSMTINCNRWLRINFSSEYFAAGQKLLVKKGSPITGKETLIDSGARVCAPEGSTNIDLLTADDTEFTGITVIGKPDISDCLVALQQGEADVLTGDDTVLAGLAVQDPNTVVVGDAFTEEPYGLGFNKDAVDFVQFVNALLEDMRTDGSWAAIYQRWLIDTGAFDLEAPPEPPAATYGREP